MMSSVALGLELVWASVFLFCGIGGFPEKF